MRKLSRLEASLIVAAAVCGSAAMLYLSQVHPFRARAAPLHDAPSGQTPAAKHPAHSGERQERPRMNKKPVEVWEVDCKIVDDPLCAKY